MNASDRASASCRNDALDRLHEVREQELLGIDGHRARFDLRQIENVADQVQQVGAGAVNRLRELDLLRRETLLGVLRELLAQDQDAVERRAQLVRHVRKELGLVARGERELRRLVLERAARELDLLVLALDLGVLLGQQACLLRELLVGLLQLALLRLQFRRELLRLLEQTLGAHRRLDGVEHHADAARQLLEERLLRGGEFVERRQLHDGLDVALVEDRQGEHVLGARSDQSRTDVHGLRGNVLEQDAPAVGRALPDDTLAEREAPRLSGPVRVGIARELAQVRSAALVRDDIHDALLRAHQRSELLEQHLADGAQVALALHHAAELREVRLEPVLLGVAVGRDLEVADHRVDVVLELGHLAARVDLDRARQVAFRHGRGDFRDRTHLVREVGGQQVHVRRQVLPGPRGTGHVGLPAESPLDADLARHRRDLVGERRQRVRHAVDGVGERGDLALRFDRHALPQVAVGDRGDDLDDAAHLARQVVGHRVDVVGQVLPDARDTGHDRLAAELAFGADLARDARDLGGEAVQLVDHRVDGFLELADLALDVDRDLARQVAARDGRRHLGDVAHLTGQVRRHRVDVVGQILPGAADARHDGLAAELAFGADLARDARDLGREAVQLVDHRVDGFLELQDLAAHVDRDLARQVAARDGRRHLGDVADLARQVATPSS